MATPLPPLGRLRRVSARAAWAHEGSDLTPWLLLNADVLSDVLGMDLELEAAEHPVGDFSLDLIGRDRATGDVVIIENQLETSDHGHLGQLLTYAGGVRPSNIVWLAPAFRPEHRAALEWLNERTDEETRFFAVQLEVVRIGESPPAPLLSLVVQPNDWGKKIRASTASTRTWTLEDVYAHLDAHEPPHVGQAARALVAQHLAAPGASLYVGAGATPSVTANLNTSYGRLQPWSFYGDGAPGGGAVFAVNFDWLYKRGAGAPASVLQELVATVNDLPGASEHWRGVSDAEWRKRPSIPAAGLFGAESALSRVSTAMAALYAELLSASAGDGYPTSDH